MKTIFFMLLMSLQCKFIIDESKLRDLISSINEPIQHSKINVYSNSIEIINDQDTKWIRVGSTLQQLIDVVGKPDQVMGDASIMPGPMIPWSLPVSQPNGELQLKYTLGMDNTILVTVDMKTMKITRIQKGL